MKKLLGFSRSRRLTRRVEFIRLFDKPKTYRAETFEIYYKQNEKKEARLGITLKGRTSSVWRIRLKRVIREWFRESQLKIGFYDLNVVIRLPTNMDWIFIDKTRKQLKQWKHLA